MKNRNYIIVTPVKNEEENLPEVIESIANQTITPSLWVILDDGSKDSTPDIIRSAEKEYEYVKSISLKGGERELGIHYASIIKRGFDYALSYIMKNDIKYNYMGIIDADMIQLETDFFEKLIKEFEKNPKLGIGSGNSYYFKEGRLVRTKTKKGWPIGPQRLWRRKCFEECGYIIAKSADAASTAKARMKGWETRGFEHIKVISAREPGDMMGKWGNGMYNGESMYFLNYNPLVVFAKAFRFLVLGNHEGIAIILAYLLQLFLKGEQIEDMDIRTYFWKVLPLELMGKKRLSTKSYFTNH